MDINCFPVMHTYLHSIAFVKILIDVPYRKKLLGGTGPEFYLKFYAKFAFKLLF